MTARCPICAADVTLVTRELLVDPGHPFRVLDRHTRPETSFVNGEGNGLVMETRQVRCSGSLEEVAETVHA